MNHSLVLNLSTRRIWCYMCEVEVYEHSNIPSFRYVVAVELWFNSNSSFLLAYLLDRCNNLII